MKTLYVTDLDGTLLTGKENVSEYSREHLNKLLDRGLIFSYATARSVYTAQRAVEGLHITAPVVLYNGGLIYDFTKHEALCFLPFNGEEKQYVLSVLLQFGIVPLVFSIKDEREHIACYMQNETEGIKRYLHRRKGDERLLPVHSEDGLLDGTVMYFKCIGPREQLEKAWNILKYDRRFICIFHQETYQNDFWMEISPSEATKANGVKFLQSYLGCESTVCFGDTSNDSDMFDVCDRKYAVMNADSWLKAKATGVIGYCEEDGVVKWLEENVRFD